MASSSSFDNLISKTIEIFNIKELKNEQKEILKASWEGTDCMAVLPTGFGKSLPYQMLSTMRKLSGETGRKKVVVCTPLLSLMQDQVQRLRLIPDVTALYLGESSEADREIHHGEFDYLFGSPELLVGSGQWREVLKTFTVSNIVIDECHTVISWGEEDKGKAFRKWFSCVGELRALFPSASVTALSATCKKADYKKIMMSLNMKPDSKIIKMSPNRPNIKLIIKKVNSIESGFLPLVEAINEKKMVNSLIYCSSIKDVSVIYSFLTAEVSQANMFIEMFHSETEEKNKTDIIKKITSKDESFIIIATSALGMGIDICSCHCVIIYSLPYNMVDLWQQIGRVGRDGSTAEAIFLYRGHQMKSSDVDVKNLYTSATCRRMTALTPFLTKSELLLVKSSTGKHTCCDICTKQCDCNNCVSNPVETLYIDSEVGSDESSSSSSGTISYEQDIGDFSEQEDM